MEFVPMYNCCTEIVTLLIYFDTVDPDEAKNNLRDLGANLFSKLRGRKIPLH